MINFLSLRTKLIAVFICSLVTFEIVSGIDSVLGKVLIACASIFMILGVTNTTVRRIEEVEDVLYDNMNGNNQRRVNIKNGDEISRVGRLTNSFLEKYNGQVS